MVGPSVGCCRQMGRRSFWGCRRCRSRNSCGPSFLDDQLVKGPSKTCQSAMKWGEKRQTGNKQTSTRAASSKNEYEEYEASQRVECGSTQCRCLRHLKCGQNEPKVASGDPELTSDHSLWCQNRDFSSLFFLTELRRSRSLWRVARPFGARLSRHFAPRSVENGPEMASRAPLQ